MTAYDGFFAAILRILTPEAYMLVTKAAGIACSFADISFIVILLKTAHALKPGAPPPKRRLCVLYAFAALTLTLVLPISGDAFVMWQSLVLGIPYLLLAHTVATEFPALFAHVRERIRGN